MRRNSRANRARILATARRELARNPDVQLEEPARASGVVRRTLFGHFPGRAALLDALAEEASETLGTAVAAGAERSEAEPAERVLAHLVFSMWPVGERYRLLLALAKRDLGAQRMAEVLAPAREATTAVPMAVTSMGGLMAGPGMSAYCGSEFALEIILEALGKGSRPVRDPREGDRARSSFRTEWSEPGRRHHTRRTAFRRRYVGVPGLHLSCFDWESNLQKCGKDYADLGAKNADFLVTDVSDRDAGWYAQPAHGGSDHFWTDQKAAAALNFYKTMAESVGKPIVLWQIPVGNMAGNNTPGHFKDDKVDWFFAHMDQVANAHVAGLMFGAGWSEQTTVESDGGNLIRKTIAYHNSGGTPLK